MRRVDAEGDSQSRRGRRRDGAQVSRASKSSLRRLALEGLEARTLLVDVDAARRRWSRCRTGDAVAIVGDSQSGVGNSSSPSVAIDPVDSQKMVSVWTVNDPGHLLDGRQRRRPGHHLRPGGAYSIDGGQTWNPIPSPGSDDGTGVIDADVQSNFSVTGSPQPHFAQTTDATVAFGRDQSVYLLTSSHDAANANGVLDLQAVELQRRHGQRGPGAGDVHPERVSTSLSRHRHQRRALRHGQPDLSLAGVRRGDHADPGGRQQRGRSTTAHRP